MKIIFNRSVYLLKYFMAICCHLVDVIYCLLQYDDLDVMTQPAVTVETLKEH